MSSYQIGLLLWAGFLISWQAAAFWKARALARSSIASRIRDILLYMLGFGLMFIPRTGSTGAWDSLPLLKPGLLALEIGGFAFAWWARIHLGRLWSGMITLREDHRVIDTGPYGLVRHPIYSGFLLSAWAFALLVPSLAASAGAAILTGQMAWKAKREERFLREQLGPSAYDAYAARVPMLVPFVRTFNKGTIDDR